MTNLTDKLDKWIERRGKATSTNIYGTGPDAAIFLYGHKKGANELKPLVVKLAIAAKESENALSDYITRIESTTEAKLYYGHSVLKLNREALKELEQFLEKQ